MTIDVNQIKWIRLTHTIKGKSTTTVFARKDFPLFKEWVNICKQNRITYEICVINNDDSVVKIQ